MSERVSHLGAVALAIAGFTLWVLCDSAIKVAGRSGLPNYEIVAFLGLFIAIFVGAYAGLRGEVKELWPLRPRRLILRSCIDVGNNLFLVIALRHLSLTLFYILVFTSPMLVAVLGSLFLGEHLGWRKSSAVLLGFMGVVVAVYPERSSGGSGWVGYAACAVCVLCFSVSIVWSRVISQAERSQSITFFQGLVTAVLGSLGMLLHAVPVSGRLLAALVVMGVLCAVGNICIFVALKHTTAATVSQYHYTQLLAGALVAYFLFREKPTVWMLLGAVLIVASGLYIALHGAGAGRLGAVESEAA